MILVRGFFLTLSLLLTINCCAQKTVVDNKYEKGLSVDGYKVGFWEYKKDDIVILKVNHTAHKVLYQIPDTSDFVILTDRGWEKSKLDAYPMYIGGMREYLKYFYKNLYYPKLSRKYKKTGTVLLSFEINLEGRPDNVKVVKDIGEDSRDVVLDCFKNFDQSWIVARKGDKAYKSKFILPIRFEMDTVKPSKMNRKEIKKLNKVLEEQDLFVMMEELVITGFEMKR